jgi:cytochrome c oxidase subunit 1
VVTVSGLLVVSVAFLALALVGVYRRGWPPETLSADGGYLPGYSLPTEKPLGLLRWVTTVDHKDIGIMYIAFGVVAALWGGTDAMMIRTELLTPGATVWEPQTYNALFTTHGLTMLFFFVTPVFFGVGNYFIPLLIEADDMAFPRINAIGFWLLPPSLVMVRAGLVTEVLGKMLRIFGLQVGFLFALEPPWTGWTLYTPLSTTMANPQVDVMLLGLHLSGLATVMGAINFIVTVVTERGDEVGWSNLDIFSWTMFTMSGIALFAFPVLGSALLMLVLDRNFGTAFFAFAGQGGGPILWQHLFWFFGHPEVYILFLPATGLVSLILPKFAGRKLFGFRFIVYSTLAIGVLSFGVWAHHMFSTGIDPRLRASFMAVTIAIAIPSAVKTFNWIATMWNGRIQVTAPMIFCCGGIGLFIIGGITGVFLASVPVDLMLQDTYYVVGHFHFIVMGVIAFSMFAGSYYWFPLLTGRMYNQRLARVQGYLSIVSVFMTFMPMMFVGQMGMPRRYATYQSEFWFTALQQIASVGAFLIGLSAALWMLNIVQSYRLGTIVTDADVWDLKEIGQFTGEWRWFERKLEERSDHYRPNRPPDQ